MATAAFNKDQWQITVEIDYDKVFNYALYHCKIPVVRRLAISNTGACQTPLLGVAIIISGYSKIWNKAISPIAAGEKITLSPVALKFDYPKLQGLGARTPADFKVTISGEEIYSDVIEILGFYEWPTKDNPALQKSIACFVQPGHPYVQKIMRAAGQYLKEKAGFSSFKKLLESETPNKTSLALQAVYESILNHYDIDYAGAPEGLSDNYYQVIRSPSKVIDKLPDPSGRPGRGAGTCIDLCLLLAGCMENISFQPLIIFVQQTEAVRHAVLGCWQNKVGKSLELFISYNKLKAGLDHEQLVLVETTGLTDRYAKKMPYEQAVAMGRKCLAAKEDFVFAIDIAAARENHLFPLEFGLSPAVIRIIREAELLAAKGSSPYLEAKHLLFSFFSSDIERNPTLVEVFNSSGIKIAETRNKIKAMLDRSPRPAPENHLPETDEYRKIIHYAVVIARDSQSALVDRSHLFLALLDSRSIEIEDILKKAGIDQEKTLSMLEESLPGVSFSLPTLSDLPWLSPEHLEGLTLDLKIPDFSVKKEAGPILLKDNIQALTGKGYCLLGLGKPDQADTVFGQILAQNSHHIYALLGKGLSLTQQNLHEQGAAYFDRALMVYPRIPALWYCLARYQRNHGDSKKALEYTYLALDLLINQKRHDEALIVIEESLHHFPDDKRLQQKQGWITRLTGELQTSAKELKILHAKIKSPDAETSGLLAGTYKRLWRLDPLKYFYILKKSYDLYHEAWTASKKKNLYVGINAAALAFLLGQPETSREIAFEILKWYQSANLANLPEVGPTFSSYWYRATQAEAELLLGHLGRARRMYADIMALYKEKRTFVESSLDQIDLILSRFGLSLDALEFVQKPIISPGGLRVRCGIIGEPQNLSRMEFDEVLNQALAQLSDKLPPNITWEVLTALTNATERTLTRLIMSAKNAFLWLVLPGTVDEYLRTCEDREEIEGFLNDAEEIMTLSISDESKQSWSNMQDFILNHCDILIAVTGGMSTPGPAKIALIAKEKKMPVIWIEVEKDCRTTYENLEEVTNLDFIIGDYLMYKPKPIDTSHIKLSEDLLDLMELLAENNHEVWAKQRMAEGWTYGPKRDDPNKKHPDLIPYSELPSSEKEYDRKTAMEILKVIMTLGYRIVKA